MRRVRLLGQVGQGDVVWHGACHAPREWVGECSMAGGEGAASSQLLYRGSPIYYILYKSFDSQPHSAEAMGL